MIAPLPLLTLTLSVDELYQLYAHARADATGEALPMPRSAVLATLIMDFRERWERDAVEAVLADAPTWLARVQQERGLRTEG